MPVHTGAVPCARRKVGSMYVRRVGRRTALWSVAFVVTAPALAMTSHYALADTSAQTHAQSHARMHAQVTGTKKFVLEYVHIADLNEASNDDCAEVYGTITVKHGSDSKDVFNLPYDNVSYS